MSYQFRFAETDQDLRGILSLQKKNLAAALSPGEISSQGFVTVDHSFEQLHALNQIEKHIVCKHGDVVIGYLLSMTTASKNDIPVLVPMFEVFKTLELEGKPLLYYKLMVVGQVCVDKTYRGKGILDQCYGEYKKAFKNKYDLAITEISARNTRSLKAHERIGFKELHRFVANDGEEWVIVFWKFKDQESSPLTRP
jgi:GNAT superfamily N-acetyltransferase